MEKRYLWYSVIGQSAKVFMTAHALYEYSQAEKCWHDVRQSSTLVKKGWVMLFLVPLFLSLVPWYIVLDFESEYESAQLVEVVTGVMKGFKYRGKLGLVTYINTFGIGLAFCRSAIKAVGQCKSLIPRSSLWSRFYAVIPVFAVVLQWPFFAFVGTALSNKGVCKSSLHTICTVKMHVLNLIIIL